MFLLQMIYSLWFCYFVAFVFIFVILFAVHFFFRCVYVFHPKSFSLLFRRFLDLCALISLCWHFWQFSPVKIMFLFCSLVHACVRVFALILRRFSSMANENVIFISFWCNDHRCFYTHRNRWSNTCNRSSCLVVSMVAIIEIIVTPRGPNTDIPEPNIFARSIQNRIENISTFSPFWYARLSLARRGT